MPILSTLAHASLPDRMCRAELQNRGLWPAPSLFSSGRPRPSNCLRDSPRRPASPGGLFSCRM
jgi:hypothetical protein